MFSSFALLFLLHNVYYQQALPKYCCSDKVYSMAYRNQILRHKWLVKTVTSKVIVQLWFMLVDFDVMLKLMWSSIYTQLFVYLYHHSLKYWFKARGKLSDDAALHRYVAANCTTIDYILHVYMMTYHTVLLQVVMLMWFYVFYQTVLHVSIPCSTKQHGITFL